MKSEPQKRGSQFSNESNRTLLFYSDNSRITERNLLLNTLALLPERNALEPKRVSKRRRQIEIAKMTAEHLSAQGFPPIFSSAIYDGLIRRLRK
jgi:hypothetical protein